MALNERTIWNCLHWMIFVMVVMIKECNLIQFNLSSRKTLHMYLQEEEDAEEVYAQDGISSYSSSLRSRLLSSLAQRLFAEVVRSEATALKETFDRRNALEKDRTGKTNGGR